jgi:O-acetyl-ADP-ribose deacetylase (regulator of RNase III)
MQTSVNDCVLELVQGDISDQQVDAIVNAANSRLVPGGGVDGAIHRRGGPSIHDDTRRRYPAGCPTGSAVVSTAGGLAAQYVIHAVGPQWSGGQDGEPDLLARVYRRSLELACGHECRSVALPSLSTGAFGYPLDKAARVALSTTVEFLRRFGSPHLVRFVLFDERAYQTYTEALQEVLPGENDLPMK